MGTSIVIKILRRLFGALWLGSLVIVVVLAVVTNLGPLVGIEVFAIRGGSMTPTIPEGMAVVAVRTAPDAIRVGDVITVRADNGVVFTHRVVAVDSSEAETWLRTQGDANATPDGGPVPVRAVVGVVALTIPVMGYLIAMLATSAGILSLSAYLIALLLTISLLEEAKGTADSGRRLAGSPDAVQA